MKSRHPKDISMIYYRIRQNNGRITIGIGITMEEIGMLKSGKSIRLKMDQLDIDGRLTGFDLELVYAETPKELLQEIMINEKNINNVIILENEGKR